MREILKPGMSIILREPWLQPAATYFLDGYLRSLEAPAVLEFGSGGSTLWFTDKGASVVSIDHVAGWQTEVASLVKSNGGDVEFVLADRPYHSSCRHLGEFDLVLVDGRDRVKCLRAAIPHLKAGGVMMLDNTERSYYVKAGSLLTGWHWCEAVGTWNTKWWFKPYD